ncbi:MAG: ABC transporter ATP-binding protein [Acidimicrobiales bacterium]
MTTAAIVARQAGLNAPSGVPILVGVDWRVEARERWVLIGANGSGKTSLLRLVSAQQRPSAGLVEVLGERLGGTDMRELRRHIGVASAAVSEQLRPTMTAHDAVVTARHGALETWWHDYEDADHARADNLLDAMGCGNFSRRVLASLSQGERQRVLLARALMPAPGLVLLDEPAAGLDLPGREALVARIGSLADDPDAPPMVLVTHHVEEIPSGMTHAMILRSGSVVAAGPIESVLTSTNLSTAFGLPVTVGRLGSRWTAFAAPGS